MASQPAPALHRIFLVASPSLCPSFSLEHTSSQISQQRLNKSLLLFVQLPLNPHSFRAPAALLLCSSFFLLQQTKVSTCQTDNWSGDWSRHIIGTQTHRNTQTNMHSKTSHIVARQLNLYDVCLSQI